MQRLPPRAGRRQRQATTDRRPVGQSRDETTGSIPRQWLNLRGVGRTRPTSSLSDRGRRCRMVGRGVAPEQSHCHRPNQRRMKSRESACAKADSLARLMTCFECRVDVRLMRNAVRSRRTSQKERWTFAGSSPGHDSSRGIRFGRQSRKWSASARDASSRTNDC